MNDEYRPSERTIAKSVPSQPEYSYATGHGRAMFTIAMLGIGIALELVSIGSKRMQLELLHQAQTGLDISTAAASANDVREGLIGLAQTVVLIITAVAFLMWFHRAHRNLPSLGAQEIKYSPGWAVGSFFVPILNLFRPYQIMKEVWNGSGPEPVAYGRAGQYSASWRLVGWWWCMWLTMNFTGIGSSRAWRTADELDEIAAATKFDIVGALISIVAAVLAIQVVRRIDTNQANRHRRHRDPGEPLGQEEDESPKVGEPSSEDELPAQVGGRTLKVGDPSAGNDLRTLKGHSLQVQALAVSSDGKHAVSSSSGKLKVWDLTTGNGLRTLQGLSPITVTRDATRVVCAEEDGKALYVWSLTTGGLLHTLKRGFWGEEVFALRRLFGGGRYYGASAVAVTPDDQQVVSASCFDSTLRVWDLNTGALLHTLQGHIRRITAVVITPDGRYAISASDDQTLKVWDLKSGSLRRTMRGHSQHVHGLAVTRHGSRVVSSSGATLKVWDLAKGSELCTLEGDSEVTGLAITPDDRYVVSVSDHGTLSVWDLEHGRRLRTLKASGRSSDIDKVKVALTPDSKRAISASETLQVWDLETGEVVLTVIGESPMNCCVVSRDGTVVAGEKDGLIHVLSLEGV